MHVVAICCAKNESDIIEAFVRHTLALVSRLVVLDNGSTDGTLEILRALESEGLPLDIVVDPVLGKYQSRLMTRLMKEFAVERHRADWVLALDADEFVVVPQGRLLLPDAAAKDQLLGLCWRTYLPKASDNSQERNPVLRIRHRRTEEPREQRRVVIPGALAGQPDAVLKQGNYYLLIGSQVFAPVDYPQAHVAHFPYRSPEQAVAKIAISQLQYLAMPDAIARWGRHYAVPFEQLKRNPAAFQADVLTKGRLDVLGPQEAIQENTVCDPIPYLGGPLRHTPACDDPHRGWLAVLRHAEQLACAHALLASTVPEESQTALTKQGGALARLRGRLTRLQRQLHEERTERQALQRSWTWKLGRLLWRPFTSIKQSKAPLKENRQGTKPLDGGVVKSSGKAHGRRVRREAVSKSLCGIQLHDVFRQPQRGEI